VILSGDLDEVDRLLLTPPTYCIYIDAELC